MVTFKAPIGICGGLGQKKIIVEFEIKDIQGQTKYGPFGNKKFKI